MKKFKIFNIIVFWVTIISIPLSFSICSLIGEANIFGVAGIVRYSWIMWTFIPIGILSLFIGIHLKRKNEKYKKNYIVAFICLPLLLIFGSYRFLFNNISYDNSEISIIEEITVLNLPKKVKTASIIFELYTIDYIKITDSDEKTQFEYEINNNELWITSLGSDIISLLPRHIQIEFINFDYFVFYNYSIDEYNLYPSNEECQCVFIAYDCDMQRLIILNDYTIN